MELLHIFIYSFNNTGGTEICFSVVFISKRCIHQYSRKNTFVYIFIIRDKHVCVCTLYNSKLQFAKSSCATILPPVWYIHFCTLKSIRFWGWICAHPNPTYASSAYTLTSAIHFTCASHIDKDVDDIRQSRANENILQDSFEDHKFKLKMANTVYL